MNGISGYQKYQSNYADATSIYKKVKEQKADKKQPDKASEQTEAIYHKGEAAFSKEPAKLSENAKNLLEELKAKYGNMDFIVADYKSEAEAARYLAMGKKDYTVLIDPDTLEQMAADEEVKAKYIGIIDDALAQFGEIKEQLESAEEAQDVEVTRIGISVGSDGTVTYFAELQKASEKQQERLEKGKEEKAEEAKKAEKQEEKDKKAEKLLEKRMEPVTTLRVKADSVEALLEKIRQADWSKEKPEPAQTGTKFDFSI
ncbi:MAG: hypothetical protein IJY09_02970 [Lachnospiraceae bacterium]|nr:hypothetical protein [Lachnospiraceae bacterium]